MTGLEQKFLLNEDCILASLSGPVGERIEFENIPFAHVSVDKPLQ
jgi:hypothetical protein